jgi:hypothetical protein
MEKVEILDRLKRKQPNKYYDRYLQKVKNHFNRLQIK